MWCQTHSRGFLNLFLSFSVFSGSWPIFEVKFRPLLNRSFMLPMRWIDHSKTILLRGAQCKKMSSFWDIALIYDSMGLSQFFEVKFRPLPSRMFMVSMGWMDHSETILLRCVLYKNVYFLRYCSYFCLYRTKPISRGLIQTLPKQIFYVFYALNGLF